MPQPPLLPADELPLVGRRSDLEMLRLALDDAVEGRGRTVIITGDAGVGKTRLVQQLAQEAVRREMLVASGSAYALQPKPAMSG